MVLSPVIGKLLHKRVVLASASPRRREILSQAGFRFEVVPSRFKETLDKAAFPTPYAYAIETAKQKALEVACRMHQKDLRAPDIVIGADTIVTIGGLILEKPVDKQDAYRMLSRLNGREHSVFTGVAIVQCCSEGGQLDVQVSEFHEETAVRFSELSEALLWDYIDSGEPMDKAGGYGIQALGGTLVESVRGDFFNVVGFPLNHFCRRLADMYHPPHPEDLRRVRHDSIPPVETFEIPSDVEGGGSDAAQGHQGCGRGRAEAGADPAQAPAGPQPADADRTLENPPPFPSDLLELIDGFKASKALFTACKLKVFDVLADEGPLQAAEVAHKVDACLCGTRRLLDVCVALGLLERTDRGYGNTQLASRHLASQGACPLHGLIAYHDEWAWGTFTHLESAVREGAPRALGSTAEAASQLVFLPGDFFKASLPDAHLYILSRILHDWAEDEVQELLRRVSGSCKPGAGLLVVDAAPE
ncbi:probable bifunctional dTTP/UTP pyrophosphatase/methyltransferase protein [Suricata suricatta]|uniref:probable bifunctional dTTP/UTP pyrophosphatase/methyltransferase protein n=1 Tax=Suricata suricatta TaxID=37032 RepID=UPI001155E697|nr:probable bifunctional dTTP/UTP pyrophosphatase/methyltransferase protein [Suricata suricatta]